MTSPPAIFRCSVLVACTLSVLCHLDSPALCTHVSLERSKELSFAFLDPIIFFLKSHSLGALLDIHI